MNRHNPYDWAAIGIILTMIVISMVMLTAAAHAGPARCGKRAEIVKVLEQRYSERRFAAGLSQDGQQFFEFYASDSGTWTALLTSANGLTCIMANGHSWKTFDAGEPT